MASVTLGNTSFSQQNSADFCFVLEAKQKKMRPHPMMSSSHCSRHSCCEGGKRPSFILRALLSVAVTFACSTEARRSDCSTSSNVWKNAVFVGVQSAAKSYDVMGAKRGRQVALHTSPPQKIQEDRNDPVSTKQRSEPSEYVADLLVVESSQNSSSSARNVKNLAYSTSTRPASSSREGLKLSTPRKVGQSTPSRTVSGKAVAAGRELVFWENMVCGAISRSVAQVAVHPMNTMKTILQANRAGNPGTVGAAATKMTFKELAHPSNWKLLTRGAGAQFLLSVPHGALNFAVLEFVRRQMNVIVERRILASEETRAKGEKNGNVATAAGPGLDFLSSCISTICCSVISTPQMMITDNIMAGVYPNLLMAANGLMAKNGILGFYSGWWPGLAGKIPSYALTWTAFQQLKRMQLLFTKRPPKDIENSIMGCIAAATTVCVMIPMDTIKTRVVTQASLPNVEAYKGIVDAAVRITREEGIMAFYRGLTPRLMSVVPMIGIQFGVYEYMKKVMLARTGHSVLGLLPQAHQDRDIFDEIAMEVAADDEQPCPVPYFKGNLSNSATEGKTR